MLHLDLGEPPGHGTRQHLLDEDVLVDEQRTTRLRRPKAPEEIPELGGEVVPARDRGEDGLEKREAANAIGVSARPMEAEAGAPVVDDERQPIQPQGLDEPVDIARVVHEAVFDVWLVGAPEADEVGRDGPAERRQVGQDVAPQVARGRLPVEEEDRLSRAHLHVVHPGALDLGPPRLVGEVRRNLAHALTSLAQAAAGV